LKEISGCKRLFWKGAVLAALVICSIALMTIIPIKYGFHYASIIDKYEMVRQEAMIQRPLVAFFGGSGLWCGGLDSPYVNKETGYNVANTGVSREFGLIFMPRATLGLLRPGDAMVIIQEYHTLPIGEVAPFASANIKL